MFFFFIFSIESKSKKIIGTNHHGYKICVYFAPLRRDLKKTKFYTQSLLENLIMTLIKQFIVFVYLWVRTASLTIPNQDIRSGDSNTLSQPRGNIDIDYNDKGFYTNECEPIKNIDIETGSPGDFNFTINHRLFETGELVEGITYQGKLLYV